MTPTLEKEIIKLPSDQDASGRTFGAEEIAAVTEVLTSGVLITTKGKYGKLLEKEFAEKLGVKYAYACNSRFGGGSRRGCGDQSESGRRNYHDFDHRYGRVDTDHFSRRDSGFRGR